MRNKVALYLTTQQNKMTNIGAWIAVFITLTSIIYSIASFWSQPNYITILANSDVAMDLYVAHNLIYEHGSLFNWHLTTSPYFIPDLLFFYLLEHVIKNISSNFVFFALFQILVLFSTILWIFQITTKSKLGIRLGTLSILFYLLMICVRHQFWLYDNASVFINLLIPGFHYGGALISFICFAFFLKMLAKAKPYYFIITAVLAVSGGCSDPLVVVYFNIPAIVTITLLHLLDYLDSKKYWGMLLLFCSTAICSFLLYHFLPFPIQKQPFHLHFSIINFLDIMKTIFTTYLKHHILFGLAWLIFMVWAPISLYQDNKAANKMSTLQHAILYLWLLVITTIPIFTVMMPTIHSAKHFLIALPIRYMIPSLLGPSLIGFPLLIYKHIPSAAILLKQVVFVNILLIASVIALFIRPNMYLSNLFDYYPSLAACVDQHAKKYGLHNGIGLFFLSPLVTDYSRFGIHIANAMLGKNGFIPQLWMSTSQNIRLHHYDFVMLGNAKEADVVKSLYGKPNHTFQCSQYIYKYKHIWGKQQPTKFQFLVYTNGKLNRVFEKYQNLR